MTKEEQIKALIRRMGGGNANEYVMYAEVTEVDEENATLKVKIDEDMPLEDVRLRSIIDGDNGIYVVPAVGSIVLLLRLGLDDDFMAVGFEKYDKVVIKGEEISLVVSQENITFNGNRLESFITDINKLTEKINNLETEVNDLKAVFRGWTPVPQDGGAKLKIGVTTWATTDITKTTVDDIKDEKILN